jgi:putative transposase
MGAEKPYPGRPPRLHTIFATTSAPLYFVTFNVSERRPVVAAPSVHDAFRTYCQRAVQTGYIEVGRYVIMPDHVHLFVRGDEPFDLGVWVRGLKRAMSLPLSAADVAPPHWQPGFFDHVLRSGESYEQKWRYVIQNPVRKSLVATAADWPYQGEIASIARE